MKNALLALIALLILGGSAYYFMSTKDTYEAPTNETPIIDETPIPVEPDGGIGDGAGPIEEPPVEVIGTSVDGNDITAHHFGTGAVELLIVGGVHSAFAPNTVDVAEELIDALEAGTITVPSNLKVTVIPNLNPDAGGSPDTLASRLNANGVDLNRNFDCDWNANGVWRNTPVSGGETAFSEPETRALRDYVESHTITAAVVYYAADGGVYASNCGGDLDTRVQTLTSTYASASGYTANDEFDAYAVSGDMTNWLSKVDVPAIGVLLSNYTGVEWEKNRAGIEAILTYYAR